MRLLVTGATGFLGRSFVAAALDKSHDVTAITRSRSSVVERLGARVVVKDLRALESADIPTELDGAVHFATGSEGSEESVMEVAAAGSLRLLDLCTRARAARFVHLSSMSVYPGPIRRDSRRLDELALDPCPEKRGLYARSKIVADELLQEYAGSNGLGATELVILRPGLVFGAGMKNVLAGTAVELPLGLRIGLGRPRQSVPFVLLEDVINGLMRILERAPEPGSVHIYNLLSSPLPSKEELLRMYSEKSGRDGRTLWVPELAAVVAAATVDAVRAMNLSYNIRRMYRFEPRDLPMSGLGEGIRLGRANAASSAVAAALTVAPREIDDADILEMRRNARELLAVGTDMPPVLDSPQPVVLVGAGRIASEMHVPVLHALPQLRVRAVVEPDERLRNLAVSYFPGAVAYGRLDDVSSDLLAGATAVVAVPGHLHASLGAELIKRGASLLMEKPAALHAQDFHRIRRLEAESGRPVTIFHNYRLRPRVLDFWRFLLNHDVGAPVKASIQFHSPRIDLEQARWMHEEKRNRTLLMELAIHFLDLACVVLGSITRLRDVSSITTDDKRATIAVMGVAEMELCPDVFFDLDVSGTATRAQLVFQFERATCVLDFFPDGFRVLPRRGNPIDDVAAGTRRLVDALAKVAKRRNGLPQRVVPHYQIYIDHLQRLSGARPFSQLSPAGIEKTMDSAFAIAEEIYAPAIAPVNLD